MLQVQAAEEVNPYDAGVLGSLKPDIGDVLVHPKVFSLLQSGKNWDPLTEFISQNKYGTFRVIVDGNIPPDRVHFVMVGGSTYILMLDGSTPPEPVVPTPAEDLEAQEMRDIEELRRQLAALHDFD